MIYKELCFCLLCNIISETMHLYEYTWCSSMRCIAIYIYDAFDWSCFYYFVRNSLVAFLEALCARIFSLDSWILVFSDILFFCVCKVSNKAFLPHLSTRLLCLVVAIPLVCWLYMCACVFVPLHMHVKMCRWSDKYLANISKTVMTSLTCSFKAIHLVRVYKRHVRRDGTSQRHKYTCNF